MDGYRRVCLCNNNIRREYRVARLVAEAFLNNPKPNIFDCINHKDENKLNNSVENLEYQTLLELRYLCFKTWEQIAVQMGYGIDNIYKMHHKALREVAVPESLQ